MARCAGSVRGSKKFFELKGEFAVSKQLLINKQINHHPREVSLFTG
jgi:hypothetical protein